MYNPAPVLNVLLPDIKLDRQRESLLRRINNQVTTDILKLFTWHQWSIQQQAPADQHPARRTARIPACTLSASTYQNCSTRKIWLAGGTTSACSTLPSFSSCQLNCSVRSAPCCKRFSIKSFPVTAPGLQHLLQGEFSKFSLQSMPHFRCGIGRLLADQ